MKRPTEYSFVRRKRRQSNIEKITSELDKNQKATLRGLPVVQPTEVGTTFDLTFEEIQFIKNCAKKWQVDYDVAVAMVIHRSLELLQKLANLGKDYDFSQNGENNEKTRA